MTEASALVRAVLPLVMAAMLGCGPTGHVPTTDPTVERQLRAELSAKHLAIWDSSCHEREYDSFRLIGFDGSDSGWVGPPGLGVGAPVGTAEQGRRVLVEQRNGDIVAVAKDGAITNRLHAACGRHVAVAQDLRHIACPGMGCKGRTPSCFSLLSSKSIASAEEIATHLRGPELIESVSWSPDASRLVYSKEGRIYLYSFGLDQSTLLTEGTGVSWSPDGAWIAFIHDGNIDLISPQGGPVRTLIENATQAEPVKWSPDSAYALASYYSAHFTAGLQELGRVEVIRISDGAELTLIYPDATGILCMEWIKTE